MGRSSSRRRLLPLILVVGLAVLFLGRDAPRLTAGFGPSHDGRNAATWGAASRALRTEGIVDSRLGGVTGPSEADRYANHPPGIVVETAVAERLAGEHRIVTRAPAWLASLAVLALVCWLLVDAGLAPLAVAAGVVAVFGSAMFLVYGFLLDTPVTSLPAFVAALLVAQRAAAGRPPPWWVAALIGLAAGLTGWPAVTGAAAAGVWLLVRSDRRRTARVVVALAGGTALGVASSVAWAWWTYGDLATLFDNAGTRHNGVALATSLRHQVGYLADLVPWALPLGLLGGLAAAADRRVRGPFTASLAAVAVYALVFAEGADVHDYWNYAILVPLGIGAAAGADWLLRRADTGGRSPVGPALLALAVVLAASAAIRPSVAGERIDDARSFPPLVDAAAAIAPSQGPVVAFLGGRNQTTEWIEYETGRPGIVVHDLAGIRALARDQPELGLIVPWGNVNPLVQARLRTRAVAIRGPFALVRARDAAAAFDSPFGS